jgi:flagellar biosynthesis protein FlhG
MVTARRQRNGRRGGTAQGLTRGEVVVIVSGKGGVGKSNLAVNLGIQLSRSGLRVVLVDADLGLANADILLNLSSLGDVSDLLDDRIPLDNLLVNGPEGLRVVCGVSGLTRRGQACDLDPLRCVRAVERLNQACDVLLIDCAAGVAPLVSGFALAGDRLILATTPEPTALTDAYATLKMLHNRGFSGRAGLIVNMARSRAEAEGVARRLQRAADRFLGLSLEDLGYVVFDRHVLAAVRERAPVIVRYPHCAASSCMAKVCRKLAPPPPLRGRPGGLWARVASLFL